VVSIFPVHRTRFSDQALKPQCAKVRFRRFFKPGTATPWLRFWPPGWGGAFVRMSEHTSYHEAVRGEPFWPSPSIAGSFRSDRFVGRGTRDKPKDSRPRLRPSGLRRRCFLRHTTSQPARSALISQNDALLKHGKSINGSGDRNSAHALPALSGDGTARVPERI
jgi:hypothetical protein